eukprot:COSAG01_NODE_51980_length_350_cov_0.816733_1_plen_39_part_10
MVAVVTALPRCQRVAPVNQRATKVTKSLANRFARLQGSS